MADNASLRAAGRVLAAVLRMADVAGVQVTSAELRGGRVVMLLEGWADLWTLSDALHADRRRFRPDVEHWADQDARPLRWCRDHEHRRGVTVTLQTPDHPVHPVVQAVHSMA